MNRTLAYLVSMFVLFVTQSANADSVNIYAAASTSDAIEDIIELYALTSDDTIVPVFAGTATLARQIEQGAPADIFLSANRAWTDELETQTLLAPGTRRNLLTNRLVLVAPQFAGLDYTLSGDADLSAALGDGRLALADVEGVPAGIYARQALQSRGEWESVEDQLVFGDSVRAALTWVARAEVSAAIVYSSDAISTMSVRTLGTYDEDSHEPIVYPLAIISGNEADPATLAFYAYLQGPTARAVFEDYGFGLAGTD